jgi:hypothetical protein
LDDQSSEQVDMPIPAFTSSELAQKHRQHRSEQRYINEQMEYELE